MPENLWASVDHSMMLLLISTFLLVNEKTSSKTEVSETLRKNPNKNYKFSTFLPLSISTIINPASHLEMGSSEFIGYSSKGRFPVAQRGFRPSVGGRC